MQLAGQVALVTGAARGIGKAIALRLASDGCDVAVADRDEAGVRATATAIEAQGRRAKPLVLDVTDQDRVQSMVGAVTSTFGKLHILINNAGHGHAKPFLEITRQEWQSQVDLNLSAVFYCAQACARVMRTQGYGRIVLISSVTGLSGPIDLAAYGAAKAGTHGLMRAMALELAEHGITTNAIAPGPIDTELLRQTWPIEMQREAGERIPARRIGKVEEVAHVAAFLASPEAAFVNGTIVSVDGGFFAAGGYVAEQYRRRKSEKSD